jgi:hypothetical protein
MYSGKIAVPPGGGGIVCKYLSFITDVQVALPPSETRTNLPEFVSEKIFVCITLFVIPLSL